MSNSYFWFPTSASRFVELTLARADDVNARLDEVSNGFSAVEAAVGNKLDTATASSTYATIASVGAQVAAALTGTSSSLVAVLTGTRTFTTEAGKGWQIGQRVRVSDGSAINILEGLVTSYSGTTLVLSVDYTEGSGSGSSWYIGVTGARGTASLSNFSEQQVMSAPNGTIAANSLQTTGAQANIDFVISAKGNGAILAQVPDNLTSGGNKRGSYAVDLQSVRTAAANVAGGTYSFVVGNDCKVTGTTGIAMGQKSIATGQYSAALGGDTPTASGSNAVALGGALINAAADQSFALAGSGVLTRSAGAVGFGGQRLAGSVAGGSQGQVITLAYQTTNATPAQMTVSASGLSAATLAALPNNSAFRVQVEIVARNASTGDSRCWSGKALIRRGVNAAATVVVGQSIAADFGDAGMSTTAVALTADTTYGSLAVTVTGIAATTIDWTAILRTVEVAT